MSARRVELTELLFLLGLVAVFYFFVIPAGITDPDGFVLDEGLPPSFSARLVAVLAAFVILLRVVRLYWLPDASPKSAPASHSTQSTDEPVPSEPRVSLTRRVWIGVGVAWLFAFGLVPVLGFPVASVLTLALMLFVLGERSVPRLVLFPIIVTLGVWILFEQLLSVKLPPGLLLPLITSS